MKNVQNKKESPIYLRLSINNYQVFFWLYPTQSLDYFEANLKCITHLVKNISIRLSKR